MIDGPYARNVAAPNSDGFCPSPVVPTDSRVRARRASYPRRHLLIASLACFSVAGIIWSLI
jgi:hypothetical protein